MWVCPTCQEEHADHFDACWHCGTVRPGSQPAVAAAASPAQSALLPMATTDSLPGHQLVRLCGLVSGVASQVVEPTIGIGRASLLHEQPPGEVQLYSMRDTALAAMSQEALARGANAIVGVRIDYALGAKQVALVAVSGTAVVAAASEVAPVTGATVRLDSSTP